MLANLLGLLLIVGLFYWCVAWWGIARFFRPGREEKGEKNFTPPASILKPVKGLDAEAYENFASFCRLDYPDYEILFGVADANDPAIELIRRLQDEFPERSIRLIVTPSTVANPKSGTLDRLSREASREVLVISDSDIRVKPDYLRAVVAPLADPEVGLTSCLYRSTSDGRLAARLEALYLNATFLPSAVAGCRLTPLCFALGATIALRRSELLSTGGYVAIGDYLADDYVVAERIADLGRRVVLLPHRVTNIIGNTTFRGQWEREVRWARNIRHLGPWDYFGWAVTFTLPLAMGLVITSGGTALAWTALAAAACQRGAFAVWMLAKLKESRAGKTGKLRIESGEPDRADVSNHAPQRGLALDSRLSTLDSSLDLLLLPFRDALTAAVWLTGLFGRRVVWRGQAFEIGAGGRLRAVEPARPLARRIATAPVRWLDFALRRATGIRDYSQHPHCLMRLSLGRAERDVNLKDGTRIARGETIGELHYWNEHMAAMKKGRTGLTWASAYHRWMVLSLEELARHMQENPRLAEVQAFRAMLPYSSRDAEALAARISPRLGLDIRVPPPPEGALGRLHAAGEQLLFRLLVWAFHPGTRAADGRREVWVTRRALLARYTRDAPAPTAPKAVARLTPIRHDA
jgi:ceramide glucosyltransferase